MRKKILYMILVFVSFSLIGCTYSEIKPPKKVNDYEIISNSEEFKIPDEQIEK